MKLCVACSAETEIQVHDGLELDVCPEGHGLWASPDELWKAIRTDPDAGGRSNTYDEQTSVLKAIDHAHVEGETVRDCPMCKRPMGSARYALATDVVIDACKVHGIWLDSGELDRLEAWAATRFAPDSAESKAYDKHLAARAADAVDPTRNTVQWRTGSLLDGFRAAFKRH